MKNGKTTWDNVESLPDNCWINNADIRGVYAKDILELDRDWYVDEIKRKIVDYVLDPKLRTRGKKYSLEGCVGVGTVAESYLAKDEKGNHVVIKMVKKVLGRKL